MTRKTCHIVPAKNGGWDVKNGCANRASAHTNTKNDAVKIGRDLSQKQHSELIIHGVDGKIQRCDSHGHDPCPPKDTK